MILMNRRQFCLSSAFLGAVAGSVFGKDDDGPSDNDRFEGYRYKLATAASIKGQTESQFVSNLRGQIGIVYDTKNGGREGITGRLWRGRPQKFDEPFSIKLEDIYSGEAYMDQQMAYDASGEDRAVTLADQSHAAISWKMVKPKDEWFKKFVRINHIPFQLQATEGKFAGYFLDFGEPELVKIPDRAGEPKDRSYVRRQAILVQDPSELSVLEKRELRER
jgi:hypothetical protein